jgi:superfamily I DNA and RNA helicase
MNRRKKGNQILKARAKKANAKLSSKIKPKYISKGDRETILTESAEDTNVNSEKLP